MLDFKEWLNENETGWSQLNIKKMTKLVDNLVSGAGYNFSLSVAGYIINYARDQNTKYNQLYNNGFTTLFRPYLMKAIKNIYKNKDHESDKVMLDTIMSYKEDK